MLSWSPICRHMLTLSTQLETLGENHLLPLLEKEKAKGDGLICVLNAPSSPVVDLSFMVQPIKCLYLPEEKLEVPVLARPSTRNKVFS